MMNDTLQTTRREDFLADAILGVIALMLILGTFLLPGRAEAYVDSPDVSTIPDVCQAADEGCERDDRRARSSEEDGANTDTDASAQALDKNSASNRRRARSRRGGA